MKTTISILTVSALLATAQFAHSGSATWNLDPTSGDWNTAANWTPATVPNGSSNIATFDVSNLTDASLSGGVTVNSIVFTTSASPFTISAYLYDLNRQEFVLDLFTMFSALPLGYNHPVFDEESFRQQIADQKIEVENLKSALHKLGQKLCEACTKADLLISQHRRSRAMTRAAEAQAASGNGSHTATFDRMKHKVMKQEAVSQARSELLSDNIEDRFASMEREQQLDKLLADLKARRQQGVVKALPLIDADER